MAITPSQWSHVLTIPESYTPSAATSGQTLLITESVIAKLSAGDQTTFWSNVQNGGGDVRICTDSGGVNQLPVEIVSLDNSAQTCVIWTRKPSFDGAGNLYLFIGKAGETQPPVTDPFGRNAVWSDYLFVHHLNNASSLVNSQGATDWDVTSVTGILTTSSNSPFGGSSTTFNGSSFARIVNNVGIADASTDPRTIQVWARPSSLPNDEMGILVRDVNSNGGFKFYFDNSETASGNSDTFILNSDSTSDRVTTTGNNSAVANTWQMIHVANEQGVVQNAYYNGALVDTASGTPMSTFQGDDQLIGGTSGYVSSEWQGELAELRIAKLLLSSEYVATEYNNQNDPATFYGTPTLATTGAPSAGVDVDVGYTVSAPTFASTASVTLPEPVANAAFSINAPTFNASANATLPQPISNAAFTINAPTFTATASATIPGFNASVSFAIPAPTFAASATATLPSPTADVSYTIAAPTFSVNADATLPQPSSDVVFTVNSPQFAVTATATEPGFNASVNFTVNAPTFTANASATLPQPDANIGFTISAPTFSVVAIVGGIAIIVDDETNLTMPALSNNVTMPALSNNLEI